MRKRRELDGDDLPLDFTKEWLIVCEGRADKAFFLELIQRRGLPDFQVQFPLRRGDNTGGWTKYAHFLDDIKTNEGFIRNVKTILVTADNDDDPATRVTEIQEQIKEAGGYGIPAAELEVARSLGGLPDIVIMMLPLNGLQGNLETCLLPSALAKWPGLASPLEEFLRNSPADSWEERKKAKTRMQCILAATCRQDPNTSISLLWTRPEESHIPVDDPCFDGIANILRGFGNLIARR